MKSLYELQNKPLTDISFESTSQPSYDPFDSLFCDMSFQKIITSPELKLVKLLSPTGFFLFQDVQHVNFESTEDEDVVKIQLCCGQSIVGTSSTFNLFAKIIN